MAGGAESGDAVSLRLDSRLAHPKKRSLTIAGHRTSITLEDAFWLELKIAAAEMGETVTSLVTSIDACRDEASLSAAIRVFLLVRRTKAAP